jgi:hypothetical protein
VKKLAITVTFIVTFLGFCAYRLPLVPIEFQHFRDLGFVVTRDEVLLEYWGFLVSNITVSGAVAAGVWWLLTKETKGRG